MVFGVGVLVLFQLQYIRLTLELVNLKKVLKHTITYKSDLPGQNGIWVTFRIFGLKMMVKSGLEKMFLKFLHAGHYVLSFTS